MKIICETNKCCSCGACYAMCPVKAINMVKNEYGEEHPIIDEEICVNCKKCIKVCQANNTIDKKEPKKCYAAWAKEKDIYKKTSSGGLATLLGYEIIRNNGVVYGASVCDGRVKHIRVASEELLFLLSGSKYVKSDITNVYKDLKRDLDDGITVLFIGTPCQIASIKSAIGEMYENLYTIDLVCHGTPPTSYLYEYIDNLGIKDYTDITFRKKILN